MGFDPASDYPLGQQPARISSSRRRASRLDELTLDAVRAGTLDRGGRCARRPETLRRQSAVALAAGRDAARRQPRARRRAGDRPARHDPRDLHRAPAAPLDARRSSRRWARRLESELGAPLSAAAFVREAIDGVREARTACWP